MSTFSRTCSNSSNLSDSFSIMQFHVAGERYGVCRTASSMRFSDDQILLQSSPLSFDASIFEIWGALLNGAELVVPRAGLLSFGEIAAAIEDHIVSYKRSLQPHDRSVSRVIAKASHLNRGWRGHVADASRQGGIPSRSWSFHRGLWTDREHDLHHDFPGAAGYAGRYAGANRLADPAPVTSSNALDDLRLADVHKQFPLLLYRARKRRQKG
jgi:hypothetical protein